MQRPDITNLVSVISSAITWAHIAADDINRGTGGREIALVLTKLQEAQMWANAAVDIMAATIYEDGSQSKA